MSITQPTVNQPTINPPTVNQPTLINAEPRLVYLRVARLEPNPYQPRKRFSEEELNNLAASVKEHGILQPITARPKPGDDEFAEILAGERRWRAAKLAGLDVVPTIIQPATDRQMAILAVVENVQRHDMTSIETARAYQRLNQEFEISVEEIARRVGKSRPVVSNLLRLLELPDSVQEMIDEGKLSESHGKALASYKAFPRACEGLAKWAVRDTVPSKSLEKGWNLPHSDCYQARDAGVIETLPYDWKSIPEFEICKKCPFDALRARDSYNHYCLKPEHFAELEAKRKERLEAESKPNTPESKAKKERQDAKEKERQEKAAQENRQREFHKETLLCQRELAQKQLDDRRAYLHQHAEGIFEGLRGEMRITVDVVADSSYYAKFVVDALARWDLTSLIDVKKFLANDTSKNERLGMLEALSVIDLFCLPVEVAIRRDTEDYWCKGDKVSAYVVPVEDGFTGMLPL